MPDIDMGLDTLLARVWVRSYDAVTSALSKRFCYGLYDGDRIACAPISCARAASI